MEDMFTKTQLETIIEAMEGYRDRVIDIVAHENDLSEDEESLRILIAECDEIINIIRGLF